MSFTSFFIALFLGLCVSAIAYFAYLTLFPTMQDLWGKYLQTILTKRESMFRPTSARKILVSAFACSLAFGFFAFVLFFGYGLFHVFITLVFVTLGWMLPLFWTDFQYGQRLARINSQLVDALELMSNSIRSGLNLSQVIELLVREMPDPISQEFALVLSQQKLGVTLEDALEKLVTRVPIDDLAVAVHSILILRETGGDLSETFETISLTIRERKKVDSKIRAITQQGRLQALLLLLLPFALLLAIRGINPGYIDVLFTTQLGWILLTVMLVLEMIGALWLRKIMKIQI